MIKKVYIFILAVILGILSITGCSGSEQLVTAKDGDTVIVHYKGMLEDGSVFDTSRDREPLEFILGSGNMIVGFDKAVHGMQVGEIKTVTIPADEAYGQHRDDLVLIIDRDKFPEGLEPTIGQQLEMSQANGRSIIVIVIDVSGSSITVDANHRLAGKDLTFEIELIEIK